VLDDVAGLEENPFERDAPLRALPDQELEIHPEMLELLLLCVLHDRPCVGIRLEGDALLVPADCLGLLGQGGDHPCERPRLGTQLGSGLVVLLESHRQLLSG
jgi:hypothetical protein